MEPQGIFIGLADETVYQSNKLTQSLGGLLYLDGDVKLRLALQRDLYHIQRIQVDVLKGGVHGDLNGFVQTALCPDNFYNAFKCIFHFHILLIFVFKVSKTYNPK